MQLEGNKSITFIDGVLRFESADSGKVRFVTKNGCTNLCDCKNGKSYHKAMFEIVAYYTELEKRARRITILDGAIKRIFTRNDGGKLIQTCEIVAGIEAWKIAPKTQKYSAKTEVA